jgi:SAM-dependent methyltransferase
LTDDPTGWFEPLYTAATEGRAEIPWDRGGAPHALLVEWARRRSALVIGAGLGDDAEYIASLGFRTLAFDVAPTAVELARERHPGSAVEYVVANLLDPPPEWRGAFDLVFESLTVQSMPRTVRAEATAAVSAMVAPGGTLLVIAAQAAELCEDGPPWPLTRDELEAFATEHLRPLLIEEIPHPDEPGLVRWRAEFRNRF